MRGLKAGGLVVLALLGSLGVGAPVRELLTIAIAGSVAIAALATVLRQQSLAGAAVGTGVVSGVLVAVLPAVEAHVRAAAANELLVAWVVLGGLAVAFWGPFLYLLKRRPAPRPRVRPTARSAVTIERPAEPFPERFDLSESTDSDDELGLLDSAR